MTEINLTIDDKKISVPSGVTVFQACQHAGIEIPHFCYHERLDIAGNCRMCLVEMEKAPKPIASCSMPAAEGMVIRTNTPNVEKARHGVMEFLLLNHPLDCPICDQGGECDLQDQAMAYGFDKGRTKEVRRAVKDKYMGPLIKTHMTRCIHCTRCVRFIEDIAGIEELGALGRGENMEIATYVESALTSELSGNIVDLCPVGALTNKTYAFRARPWELRKTDSIDVMDAVGSNIRIDSKGNEVLRVLPRLHEDVNEEWISDVTRHACDGLKVQRLDRPYVRVKGKLEPASWEDAFSFIANRLKGLKGPQVGALVGPLADVESMYALKNLMASLNSPNMDCNIDGLQVDVKNRASYIFNTTIAGIERSDACLIVGSHIRFEAPLIQARLRKRWKQGGFPVALIGEAVELTHSYTHLGESLTVLDDILSGKHDFAKILKAASHPMIIIGTDVLTRNDTQSVLNTIYEISTKYNIIKDSWNGFNVVHKHASRVGALDIGFTPAPGGMTAREMITSPKLKALYLMGVDEGFDPSDLRNKFIIYQGHHGDKGAQAADVILPGAAYTEKDALYVNTEGRVQRALRAVFPPGEAREDWKILRALSQALGESLPFDTLEELRMALQKDYPIFKELDFIYPQPLKKMGRKGKISDSLLTSSLGNFYMNNVISKNSPTMAKCTRELWDSKPSPEKRRAA